MISPSTAVYRGVCGGGQAAALDSSSGAPRKVQETLQSRRGAGPTLRKSSIPYQAKATM
jgi:hypothetical protein